MKYVTSILLILVLLSCKSNESSKSSDQNLKSSEQQVDFQKLNTDWWVLSNSAGKMEFTNDAESLPPARFREKWSFDVDKGTCWKTQPGKDDRPVKMEGKCQSYEDKKLIVIFPNQPADTLVISRMEGALLTLEH